MSIPRLAIHRPVTMFMLSAVIVLLGAISLSKLPVDLMPEFTAPTISINTNYANVGPLRSKRSAEQRRQPPPGAAHERWARARPGLQT